MPEAEPMVEPSATGTAAPAQEDFEPTAHDELRAEQEARAAIQDAFTEPAEPEPTASTPVAFDTTAAEATDELAAEPVADAAAEHAEEAAAEPGEEAAAEPAEEAAAEAPQQAIQDAFSEPGPSVPGAPIDDAAAVRADVVEYAEAPSELGEQEADAPGAAIEESTASSEPPPDEAARAEIYQPADAVDQGALAPVETTEDGAPEPMASSAGEPGGAATAAAPAAPRQRGEEELMWLGDEFEEAGLEIATRGWRSADAPARAPERPVLELSDAELAQLAADEGWDAAEVEAIRSLLGRPNAAAPSPAVAERPVAGPPPAPGVAGSQSPAPAEGAPPMPPRRHSMSSMSDPQWLKGRRGPAATAYRRLRRLFPG
jgi:hypothetical protein